MTRSRRPCPCARVVCAALLIGAAAILSGCGSAPTAEQEGGVVAQEDAQAPEEAPAEGAAADEPTPAESAAPAQSTGSSAPPTGRAAPRQPAAEPPSPAQAVPAVEPPAPTQAAAPAKPVAAAAPAVDWVGSAQKWVPIFSLESEGVYLGAAQVAGPSSQITKVKGVAELRLQFKSVGRVYAYVPVSTISLTKLDRVQGVSVWAVGDLELAEL